MRQKLTQVIVTAEGARHVYEKMAELPFDSFRKCMTVIVKDAEGVSTAQWGKYHPSDIYGLVGIWKNIYYGLVIVFLQSPVDMST